MEVKAGGERGLKGVGEPVEDGGDMGEGGQICVGGPWRIITLKFKQNFIEKGTTRVSRNSPILIGNSYQK